MSADLGADRGYLRSVQYNTDANLAKRQSIYSYQRPHIDLPSRVLDAAAPGPGETIADIGCGNGAYLAELERRGHRGRVLGVDMSTGMLAAARRRSPHATLLAADATALPMREATADLTLANHMLYHVPEPSAAIDELRRITRPGGRVIITLNGRDHLRELRALVADALTSLGTPQPPRDRLTLDAAETLLRAAFPTVIRHDFTGALYLPDHEPVADYVRSMPVTWLLADPGLLTDAVVSRLRNATGSTFTVTTHCGCLVCG